MTVRGDTGTPPRSQVLLELDRLDAGSAVAVVGHAPDLSEWAAWLIGGKKAHIDLAKAGIALIRCPEGPRKGACSLIWLVTPDWLVARNGQANV